MNLFIVFSIKLPDIYSTANRSFPPTMKLPVHTIDSIFFRFIEPDQIPCIRTLIK